MPLIRSTATIDEPASTLPAPAANLEADLRSDDVAVRRAAVRSAGQAKAADLLVARVELESDKGVRESIMTNLVRIGNVGALRALIELLRSEDAELRNAVIETLQSAGDAIVPDIERLLGDPDSDVRIFALNILLYLRSARVAEIALRVVRADPHVNVCAAAIDVIAEVGAPDMAGPLRELAVRFADQTYLSFAVRTALKRIG